MWRTITAGGLFVLLLGTGGLWLLLGLLPAGLPRTIGTVVLALAFAAVFLFDLVRRLRLVLGDPKRLWVQLLISAVNVGLFLVAFAVVYQRLGIYDTSPEASQVVSHRFSHCMYYSVVTFTTLGYGDFQPSGIGRFVAALQAVLGYLVLGVLASTSATLIKPAEQDSEAEQDDPDR
jgi:hypothetical protein